MKATRSLIAVMAVVMTLLSTVQANQLESSLEKIYDNQLSALSHFLYSTEVALEWYVTSFVSQAHYDYKPKHQRSTPMVTSFQTQMKNNFVLFSSIGITLSCYYLASVPLTFTNDAGAFFTDCITMWTMYVFFYEDERAINYQDFA